jgi:anti-anti-sigma factor
MAQSPDYPVHVQALSGRLDASTASRIRQDLGALIDQGHRRIVIDLAAVSYLSSSILRVFLVAHRQARQAGGDLVLCALQPHVLRVFRTVGFDQVFTLYEDADAAARALAERRQPPASSSAPSTKEKR